MGTVILQLLPLALGSIAPVMIGAAILFFSITNGLGKASAAVSVTDMAVDKCFTLNCAEFLLRRWES